MPRTSTIDVPGALHHVIIRGIERRRIFWGGRDYDDFLERLALLIPVTQTACLAWVLLKGDERILGDQDFVQQVLEQANEQLNRRYACNLL